jgi:hypothetical protein
MLAAAFISWWYGAGWRLIGKRVSRRLDRTLESFSVPTLARTLFAPWKRIVTTPGAGIGAHLRAAGDNFISRLVGFSVRCIVLVAATVSMGGIAVFGLIQFVIWPLIPVLVVVGIIMGLR